MKISLTTFAIFALLLETSAWAQGNLRIDPTPDPTLVAKPIPELDIVWRMDRNHDQSLQPSEIPMGAHQFVESLIEKYDAETAIDQQTNNIDLNRLDLLVQQYLQRPKQEMKPARRKMTNQQTVLYAAQLIALYDQDQDQQLQAREFKKLSADWIECDINQDFQLDVVEVASGLKYALDFPRQPDGTFDGGKSSEDAKAFAKIYQAMKAEFATVAGQPKTSKPLPNSRQLAGSLLESYDSNHDGVLDRPELKEIGDSWLDVDFDKDGQATIEEIQVRFKHYQSQSASNVADSGDVIDRQAQSNQPNHNSLSDTMRVPAKPLSLVSGEFHQLDANQNGQIEMHEFSQKFNAAKVDDFYQRDFSGDGVITKNEWNRFSAIENKTLNAGKTSK